MVVGVRMKRGSPRRKSKAEENVQQQNVFSSDGLACEEKREVEVKLLHKGDENQLLALSLTQRLTQFIFSLSHEHLSELGAITLEKGKGVEDSLFNLNFFTDQL